MTSDRLSWLLFVAFGAGMFLGADHVARAVVKHYKGSRPKEPMMRAQTTANRLGGIVCLVLGLYGLAHPTFLR
jgi:hypothetical protein